MTITLVQTLAGAPSAEAAGLQPRRRATGSPDSFVRGLNYLSMYHEYSADYTTDAVLRRDFFRFQQDRIGIISLSLYWYRLEGNNRGDYSGEYPTWPQGIGGPYGNRFLDNVIHVISVANEYNIGVLVTFHTLWGVDDSPWCTPDYVVDPVTGLNDGLAIVRSEDMKQAFLDMANHTVAYLSQTPGIWAWAILNEPWYWPHNLDAPYNNIDQKESFIDLIQRLSALVKKLDGRPVTIRFGQDHEWLGSDGVWRIKNLFTDDWGMDDRLFSALDFVSINEYIPDQPELLQQWKNIVTESIVGCSQRGKQVWITELGYESDDDAAMAGNFAAMMTFYKTLPVAGWFAWFWRGDTVPTGYNENPGQIGKGMNLCGSADGTPRPAYYEMLR